METSGSGDPAEVSDFLEADEKIMGPANHVV
jgi:hypothetical protein